MNNQFFLFETDDKGDNESLEYPDYESIVEMYTKSVKSMSNMDGGETRGTKGAFVENIVDAIVSLAWCEIGGEANRFDIQKYTRKISISDEYVKTLTSQYIKNHIEQNKDEYIYEIELDRSVKIDQKLVLGIECKSYMDHAMFKRTLIDFGLITKLLYPKLLFCVFQLENGLGGDYGEVSKQEQLGSVSTHTLLSHTPEVYLEIITLLDGKRSSSKPIHKPKYFKELPEENVEICVNKFKDILQPFV